MAKKFFYNRVYNTKRIIVNIAIIVLCVAGIVGCFILTSNFEAVNTNVPEGTLSLKETVTVEVNQDFQKEIFFSKIENVDLNTIQIDYPDNYDITNPGEYNLIVKINDKNYNTLLTVVDTTKPVLSLKEVTINEGSNYSVKDFVAGCADNSNKECNITFYDDGINEEGNKIDYSNYKKSGTYAIKIAANDASGNKDIKETTLIINKSNNETPNIVPVICKYGDNIYDTNVYLLAADVTTNKCAVNPELYNEESMTTNINNLMETETKKIKKDIEALNLVGTLGLNRKITAIVNTSKTGLVGYELKMTVTLSNNGSTETVVEYKVDPNGKRLFINNSYNLSN